MRADQATAEATNPVRLPRRLPDALRAIGARLIFALFLVLLIAAVVYTGRSGYRDVNVNGDGNGLSLLDAAYYAVVTLSTTGYGDITPVSESARLVSILLVTPARILFLIILIGTTLEVLTEQYRNNVRLMRWRKRVKDHVIVCGYGTKGRSAVNALLEDGIAKDRIVIVERDAASVRQAATAGFAVIEGSATRAAVLTEAHVARAKAVIVAAHSDEAAVLITLTARQLTNGQVRIIAAAREAENAPLLKQSGAHHVVVSSATAGRLLGMSTTAPPIIDVVEDLLTPGAGMVLAVRSVTRDELGMSPRELDDVVIAVVRRGRIIQLGPEAGRLANGDSVVYVRSAQPAAAAAEQ
ncbi:MAG: potassium transporter Kef [Actinomycetia bacterium]|nr:potassium transporter Kef [Actinomycetes bacterium]MDQ1654716.1 voltage-gated potassium channel [Cryptosporangiaceae bacterium]